MRRSEIYRKSQERRTGAQVAARLNLQELRTSPGLCERGALELATRRCRRARRAETTSTKPPRTFQQPGSPATKKSRRQTTHFRWEGQKRLFNQWAPSQGLTRARYGSVRTYRS
ncbi:hypothetical protein H920_04209 [Fukomys damarensis]|uniref:Uncharacterized protein n=1 Tax=Fukomys damarensis TaxID=885580 RepID=A0A091DTH0_FUKDA|nr:hypothetical protein H920_04209 [Fukomys damarensis]